MVKDMTSEVKNQNTSEFAYFGYYIFEIRDLHFNHKNCRFWDSYSIFLKTISKYALYFQSISFWYSSKFFSIKKYYHWETMCIEFHLPYKKIPQPLTSWIAVQCTLEISVG